MLAQVLQKCMQTAALCTYVQAAHVVQVLQSQQQQQQQPPTPCAAKCDGQNKPGGGSSSSVDLADEDLADEDRADEDLADQMAALFSKQQPIPPKPAAAGSSEPAADNLPPAASTGPTPSHAL